jgi:hypothetical protein
VEKMSEPERRPQRARVERECRNDFIGWAGL